MTPVQRRRSDSARAKGRATLTRAEVLAAAARLLEEIGLDGLSMRRLAAALGTGPATLYWHVRDKDELLLALLDDTLRPVTAPPEGDWAQRLTVMLRQCRVALRARPTLVLVLWGSRWDLGPETMRVADELVGLVAASGLAAAEVADAYFALLNFTLGVVSTEARTPGNTYRPDGRYPQLDAYGPGTDPERMDARFDSGIRLIIAGIAARAAAS